MGLQEAKPLEMPAQKSMEERVSDLESRLKRCEAALMRVIGQLAAHKHLPDGKAAIEIELLNLQ